VTALSRTPDQKRVRIEAQVDEANPPPANVVGRIRSQIVGGGSNVALEVPEGQQPQGRLQAHAKVEAVFLGVDLLPPEFAQLATELRLMAQQLRESKLTEHLDQTIVTVRTQVEHAGKLIDSLNDVVADPKLREDLRQSMAQIRTATETANRIGANLEKFTGDLDRIGQNLNTVSENANTTITKTQAHIDELSKQMNDRLIQVATLLDRFQSIAMKIDQGQGTAGKLINDAKLYESLVETSKELNLTITDLKLLVKQWTDEGVYLKLNK
jgi:ABC-type transporter Mla subunit MlaD